jgi:hypothetical protein
MEQRKSCKDVKGKAQSGETLERPNTDELQDGRLLRSSDDPDSYRDCNGGGAKGVTA